MYNLNNRLIFFTKFTHQLPLCVQIILRKFLEFITLFKNLVDLLSLNNQNQLSKYFDSYILREIYSLCYFIKKFFKLKYCLIFFCVKIQSILINFDLIFDKWLEKIEKFIIIYENINKIGYYISFKKLQYFFNRNKNLMFVNETNLFVKILNFKIIVTIRKWFFRRISKFPSWFFIKKCSENKKFFILNRIKLKKNKIPFFLDIKLAKKTLIIGNWNKHYLKNLTWEKIIPYHNFSINCLEDLIDYFGIKACKEMINEVKLEFFLNSIKKIISFYFLNNQQKPFFPKLKNNKITFNIKYYLTFFPFFFKKNISKNLTTKINIKFLDIYCKISIILTHFQQLKQAFSNIIFIKVKSKNLFNNKYFRIFFLLRMKFLSFIRTYEMFFTNYIFKNELKFYLKIKNKIKFPVLFFNECHYYIKKLYKLFFLNTDGRLIFVTFTKVFSSIYSLKYLIKSNMKKKNIMITKIFFKVDSYSHITRLNFFFNKKINYIDIVFQKNFSIFISFIYSYQNMRKIISTLILNFFHFRISFN